MSERLGVGVARWNPLNCHGVVVARGENLTGSAASVCVGRSNMGQRLALAAGDVRETPCWSVDCGAERLQLYRRFDIGHCNLRPRRNVSVLCCCLLDFHAASCFWCTRQIEDMMGCRIACMYMVLRRNRLVRVFSSQSQGCVSRRLLSSSALVDSRIDVRRRNGKKKTV